MTKAKNEKSKTQENLHCDNCQEIFVFIPRESQLLCYNCHNEGKVLVRDDHARSQKRKLMCADCEKPFDFDPSGHINEAMRKYHFSTKRTPIFCYACQEQRSTYTCTRCGQTRPCKGMIPGRQTKRESVHRRRL